MVTTKIEASRCLHMRFNRSLFLFSLVFAVPAFAESSYRWEVYVKVESGPLADTRETKSDLIVVKDKGTVAGEFSKIGKKFDVEIVDGTRAPTPHYKGMQIVRLRLHDTGIGSGLTMVYPLGQKVMDGSIAIRPRQ